MGVIAGVRLGAAHWSDSSGANERTYVASIRRDAAAPPSYRLLRLPNNDALLGRHIHPVATLYIKSLIKSGLIDECADHSII